MRDNVGRSLYLRPELPEVAYLLAKVCRPGDTVIDVGASIGVTARAALHAVGPTGRVVAIEPVERTYAQLSRNGIGLQVIRGAVGRVDGEAVLTVSDTSSDTSSLRPHGALGTTHIERVPLLTLKSLGIRADVVKLDIEGGEWDALRGMLPEIRPRAMLIECLPRNTAPFGYHPAEMLAWLEDQAFRVEWVTAGDVLAQGALADYGRPSPGRLPG